MVLLSPNIVLNFYVDWFGIFRQASHTMGVTDMTTQATEGYRTDLVGSETLARSTS